jgi:hypothetical protein
MPAKAVFSLPHAAMAVYPEIGLDVHQSARIIRRTARLTPSQLRRAADRP